MEVGDCWVGLSPGSISIFAVAIDGSNSANFGSLVLDGYGRVVVLVSLIAASNARSSLTSQHFIGLLEPLVVVCGAVVCRFGL